MTSVPTPERGGISSPEGVGEEAGRVVAPRPGPRRSAQLGGGQSRALYIRMCRVSDMIVAVAALIVAFVVTNIGRMPDGLADFLAFRLSIKSVMLLAFFGVAWRVICHGCGLYDWERIRSVRAEIGRVVVACTLAMIIALIFPLTTVSGAFEYHTVLQFWILAAAAVSLSRLGLRGLAARADLDDIQEVVIVGRGPRGVKLWQQLQREPDSRYRVLGFVDSADAFPCPTEVSELTLGTLEQFESILMHRAVDEVLIALPVKSRYADIQLVIGVCESVGVRARYLADIFEYSRLSLRPERPEDRFAVARTVAPDDYRKLVKRAIDVAGATAGLVLLAPLMLVAATAVRLSGRGPVIFAQDRYGFNRRRFRMFKFRTMVADAESLQMRLEAQNEASGPVFKIRADPRVTRAGRLLRKFSIDELPQLVNVLRGDMSLVGPRPLPIRDVHRFTESALMRRFSVRPGLTCLWQISGRSDVSFDRWIALDLAYIDGWSLILDWKILARTVPVVLKGTGAT
jgi:exopolysaccharide biosynthesis polyprenyl glycosylphosphotransferase